MTHNLISFFVTPLAIILKKAWGVTWLAKILMLVLAYMEPIKNIYHLAIVAVIINFFLGFYKNKKLYGESFNGSKARHTLEKIGIFTIYIAAVYLFEIHILKVGIEQIYVTRVLTGILILAELKSISENGDKITKSNIFTSMYKAIRRIFRSKGLEK